MQMMTMLVVVLVKKYDVGQTALNLDRDAPPSEKPHEPVAQ
jgi:hypothetical protein